MHVGAEGMKRDITHTYGAPGRWAAQSLAGEDTWKVREERQWLMFCTWESGSTHEQKTGNLGEELVWVEGRKEFHFGWATLKV